MSRDSSLWRSLAMALGDGVAFGVGVKLTQGPSWKTAAVPAAPSTDSRLAEIEQRLDRIERAPAVAPGPTSSELDRQILNALVNTLEARLQENSGKVDHRLAELEARIAIELKSLHQQDQSLAAGAQTRVEEVQTRLDQELLAIRRRLEDDFSELHAQVISLHREFAAAVANIVEEQIASQVEKLDQNLQERVTRASSLIASTTETTVEQKLAPIRDQIADKDRDISELRKLLKEADQKTLDVILAIGDFCRRAAGQIGGRPAREPEPEATAVPKEVAAPATAAAGAAMNGDYGPVPKAEDSDVPGFAQQTTGSNILKIPLVSSFLITAGGLFLLHYF